MNLMQEYIESLNWIGINSMVSIDYLVAKYSESHRFYHTFSHIDEISSRIISEYKSENITEREKNILLVTALYHDCIYDPRLKDNEKKSAEKFIKDSIHSTKEKEREEIVDIILGTTNHTSFSKLSEIFFDIDLSGLKYGDLGRMINDGLNIMKEYQFYDYGLYKIGRDHAVLEYAKRFPENKSSIDAYLQWLKYYKPKIGVYAGSFDPFHLGHLDILRRAEMTYDKVIVAIGINPDKNNGGDMEQRRTLLQEVLPYHQVEYFTGYLTDYVDNVEKSGVEATIVKGLRGGEDLNYETNQLRYSEDYVGHKVKMHYIVGDANLSHISSSYIKKILAMNVDHAKKYLP